MSTITTPSIEASSRRSSASAGDRFETLAPWNGERVPMTSSSRGRSGAASSATETVSSRAATHEAELGGAAERLGGEAIVEGIGSSTACPSIE